MPQILPLEDGEISQALTREFRKRKIKVLTEPKSKPAPNRIGFWSKLSKRAPNGDGNGSGLVSIGRRAVLPPGFPGEIDPRGHVMVNGQFQSTIPHIYAAGDGLAAYSWPIWPLKKHGLQSIIWLGAWEE